MPTSFDDAFLERLVQEILDTQIHITTLRSQLALMGVSLETLDEAVAALRQTPESQQAFEKMLRRLKGIA